MARNYFAFALCLSAISVSPVVPAAHADSVRQIVDTFAKSFVHEGAAIGVGVAVVDGDKAPRLFAYGKAVAAGGGTPAQPFATDSLFEIGSVTKVFTTNLLGQSVAEGTLDLDMSLADFDAQLPTLKRKMSKVKLKELGDFTGGISDYAPPCSDPNPPPGCLPSARPTLQEYGGHDFRRYFAHAKPMNYTTDPASKTKLPAPYFYSDYSVGLLGLLLAGNDAPLDTRDLDDWMNQVDERILTPLEMDETYLHVPTHKQDRLAGGYDQALASATLSGGSVSAITVNNGGANYSAPPRVRIVGGGGTGARATATGHDGRVESITVTKGGSGYVAPAQVLFTDGGSSTAAIAHSIVKNGQMTGIAVTSGGAGYSQVPQVLIQGGRVGGTNAVATAHLANGKVAYVTIDNPGAGYVDVLAVRVDPGSPLENVVPIWGAAGSLTTSIEDMAKFAHAATRPPRGHSPDIIGDGFRIAQRAYACFGPDPSLSQCPAQSTRSALAWQIQPADPTYSVPEIISKDGGLPGFTTFVAMMPSERLGVVVFANSREGTETGPTVVAPHIANNILYALFDKKSAAPPPGR